MKLFVGLGNPGAKYERHRHNVGFMAVEEIARRYNFDSWRKKFQGQVAEGRINSTKCLLLKPETYMNDSGFSVSEALRFYKLDLDDVFVFHDEIDLKPGKIRVKTGGGSAGHNGLKSITAQIGNEYVRVRIGVGHPGQKDIVHKYVLQNFSKADQDWLPEALDAIANASHYLAEDRADKFMNDVARALNKTPESNDQKENRQVKDKTDGTAKSQSKETPKKDSTTQSGPLAEKLRAWFGKDSKDS